MNGNAKSRNIIRDANEKKGTTVCRLWKTNLILLKEPEESRTRTEQNATLADLKNKKRATC
jgi:hypothetical protein